MPSNLYLLMSRRLERIQYGSLSITSRRGRVGTSVLALCVDRNFGFSRFVSNGNEADLHIEDYLAFYGEDETTKVILGYTEGIRDGDRFIEIAQGVNRKKPVVMLMAGSTDAGARGRPLSHRIILRGLRTSLPENLPEDGDSEGR
jgi:acyl-CoA synthetase (NDP forming)